jgi:CHAT domain-containing protein/Tfp pilus assembly protein PilF
MGRIPSLLLIGFLRLTSAVFQNRLWECMARDGSKHRGKLGSIFTLAQLAPIVLLLFLCQSSYSSGNSAEELSSRAEGFYAAANFDSSIALGKRALLLTQQKTGISDTAIATILLAIGKYQFARGAYAASDSADRRAVQILEGKWGCCSSEVLRAKVRLAEAERFAKKPQEADSLLGSIISQAATLQVDKSIQADAFCQLGIGHRVVNEYDSSRADFAKALALYDMSQGDYYEQKRDIAISQGRILIWESNYADGEALFETLIPGLKQTNALDSLSLAESYYNLGQAQRMLRKYPEAMADEKAAIAIRKKILGTHHYLTGEAIYVLAMIYQNQGNYDDCKPLLEQTLAIYRSSVGEDNYRVGGILRNLARLHDDLGQAKEAESLYVAAVANREKSLSLDHPGIAQVLIELAAFYLEHNRYAEAEPLLRRALQIQEKAFKPNHPDIAASLDGLGKICFAQKRYDEALTLFHRALSISEKVFGPEHVDDASCLQDIALVYLKQGRYDEAGRAYERALAINRRVLNDDHPLMARCLEASSNYKFVIGDYRGALSDASSAYKKRRRSFIANCQVLSEADALRFSQKMRSSADKCLTDVFSTTSRDPALIDSACDIVLATKGEVSDEMFARRKSLVSTRDSKTLKTWAAYLQARRELSKVYIEEIRKIRTVGFENSFVSLYRIADSLESEVALQSADFRRIRARQDVTTSMIASLVPKNAVLVEYMKYNHLDIQAGSRVPHYLVAVIEPKGVTLLRDIGPASPIDSVTSLYTKHFRSVAAKWPDLDKSVMSEAENILGYLYRKIFQPLQDLVKNYELVLISPDGALNLVSFGSLKNTDGKYLIEQYRIHYLSAARDLLRLKEKGTLGNGVLALGDPDFDATPSQRQQALYIPSTAGRFSRNRIDEESLSSESDAHREPKVAPLPYTRREIERLTHLWETLGSGPVDVLLGPAASEERFKRDAPGKHTIHLATHGFFNLDHVDDQLPEEESVGSSPLRNPLLLSGLLLAGANLQGIDSSVEGNDEGFLTADEVAGMDLEGTQWVVLSACETGLGEIETGEGIYGLRRAFQMAGARTVISSLWQVPDKETSKMMENLYAARNGNLSDAMREMALRQIAESRSRGLPDHPFLWGAFIAVGDWRVAE